MNKIGKMEGQEKLKQYNELSAEELKRLKNTTLEYYERYNKASNCDKKQMVSDILGKYGLETDVQSNRQKVSKFISNEKQRRKRENKKTLMPTEGPKCRNRLSLLVCKEINDFIINKNLHTEYLEAEYNKVKRANITKVIVNEFKIDDYPKNRKMIRRLILQTTFKLWSDAEEKALEELLRDKIYIAVWNKSGDNKEIIQVRKQIMNKFKERFPASEHNDYDIMNKMNLIVCQMKRTTPKQMEVGQIEPVQQAISHVMENQMRFDSVCRIGEKNILNDFFPQFRDPEATNNVDKATLDAIQRLSNISGLINGFSKQQ